MISYRLQKRKLVRFKDCPEDTWTGWETVDRCYSKAAALYKFQDREQHSDGAVQWRIMYGKSAFPGTDYR